jgi:hypothetical protein
MKATACVMTGVLVAALGCGRSAPSAPVITRQPQDARIPGCGSAAFAVSADGTGPLSYQWSKNGAPIAWASGSTYSLSNALPSEDGSTYSVTVSNPGGEATSRVATLSVGPAPDAPAGTSVVAPERADGIIVVGDEVYWSSSGVIHGTSTICPGTIHHLLDATGIDPVDMRYDAGILYWWDSGNGSIYAQKLDSPMAFLLADTGYGTSGLTVHDGALVWIWSDSYRATLYTLPIGSTTVASRSIALSSGRNGAGAVTADDLYVYWAGYEGGIVDDTVLRMAADGTIVSLATGQGDIWAIASDGTDVFWVATIGGWPDQHSVLRKVDRDGGRVTELDSRPTSSAAALALDSRSVYWAASAIAPPGGPVSSGAISVVAKDGSGPSTVVVGDLVFLGGIYLTPQFVYWTQFALPAAGQNGVMRTRR